MLRNSKNIVFCIVLSSINLVSKSWLHSSIGRPNGSFSHETVFSFYVQYYQWLCDVHLSEIMYNILCFTWYRAKKDSYRINVGILRVTYLHVPITYTSQSQLPTTHYRHRTIVLPWDLRRRRIRMGRMGGICLNEQPNLVFLLC